MKKARIDDTRVPIAARLWADGLTQVAIAKAMRVSVNIVRRWRQFPAWKAELPEDCEARRRHAAKITARVEQGIATAARMWKEGLTQPAIAKALGVSVGTVERWRRVHADAWKAELPEGFEARKGRGTKITARVEQGICRATAMLVGGATMQQTAEAVGVRLEGLRAWQDNHRDLWNHEFQRAAAAVAIAVRAKLGTAEVLEDPDGFVRQARACERLLNERGESLFPERTEPTLTTFYRDHYLPVRLAGASPATLASFQTALNRWRFLTGDPPLRDITPKTLALFRDALAKMAGRDGVGRMSSETIRGYLRHVQCLLDKAGPPGRRNRDAAGILEHAPWVMPPRAIWKEPQTVTEDQITAVYRAAAFMEFPRVGPYRASAWWRALIVLVWSTGLRRGTVFALRWEFVKWDARRLIIPGNCLKSRRPLVVPLTETAIEHLRRIRTDAELVFPLGAVMKSFYRHWHALLEAAGIPQGERFGLHAIRRTLATSLWDRSPEAAVLMLGHSADEVTRRHYVRAPGIIARALDALPQPAAFVTGGAITREMAGDQPPGVR